MALGSNGVGSSQTGNRVSIFGVLPEAIVNVAYSFVPQTLRGSGAKTFSLGGSLPAGLSFSSSTGAITGTPTGVGTTSGLSITVTDASGSALLSGLSLIVTGTPAAATLRNIATRTASPNTRSTTNLQVMSRRAMHNRAGQPVSSLFFGIPNWYGGTGGNGEVTSGGSATFTASIEYPEGTFTQVTFSGATSGTTAAMTILNSDTMTLPTPIPDNAVFFINIYGVFASGGVYSFAFNSALGDKGRIGASVADSTMAAFTNTGSVTIPPSYVVAMGTKPSTFIFGNSRAYGTGATTPDQGEITPSLIGSRPFYNGGIFGANIAQATTANRQAIMAYHQNCICEAGINDITGGDTLATIQGSLANLKGRSGFSGKPFFFTTKPPVSSSTDLWATLAGQTTHVSNPVRIQVNDWIRSNPAGYAGYFEIADVVESSRNSGLWAVNGSANFYNSDSTHENNAGFEAIRASGAINPAVLN